MLEFLLLANSFFTSAKKHFFLAMNIRQFFLCLVEEMKYLFFVVCLPYYVRYHFMFFWSTCFHQFRQQTFFSGQISTNFFFLTFVATNFFFSSSSSDLALAPPPSVFVTSLLPKHFYYFCAVFSKHRNSHQQTTLLSVNVNVTSTHNF